MLVSVLPGFAFASVDSLAAAHGKATTPDERASLAFAIATKTLFSEPRFAAGFLLRSAAEADNIRDHGKTGKCFNALGVYYLQTSYDSAIYYLDKAQAAFRKVNDEEGETRALRNRGLALAGKGDEQGAIKAYLDALVLYRKMHDTGQVAAILCDIGNSYARLKNWTAATAFQQDALHLLLSRAPSALLGNVYNSLGYIYDEQRNYDSAVYFYRKSLVIK